VASSRHKALVLDLWTRNPIDPPNSIKALLGGSFVFLDNDRFMGVAGNNGEKSAVVQFPSGATIYNNLVIGGSDLEAVAHGDHVLLRPIKDHPVGIFDLRQNKIVLASKRAAIDVWDDNYIAERLDGDLLVLQLSTVKPLEHAQLPDAPLGKLHADALSPDLNWLAISQSTRGAVWNVLTGQRLYHVRAFSAAYFGTDGNMYADFPKYLSTERALARASLTNPDIQMARPIDNTKRTIQVGRYLVTSIAAKDDDPLNDIRVELWDVMDQKVVWSRNLPYERPGIDADSRANSLVLYWPANSKAVKSIAKEDSEAAGLLSRYKDKDGILLVQVFDLDSGKQRAELAVDTGKRSFRILQAIATADRLALATDTEEQKRVLVYTLDGELKTTITGHALELAAKTDLLTVKTERGELELYDLSTAQKRATYSFNSAVAFDGFSGDGKRLLVLTSDQVVYVLDPSAKDTAKAVASK